MNTLRVERRRGGPARILPRTLMDSWRNASKTSAVRATADLKPAGEGVRRPPTAGAIVTLNTRVRVNVSPRRCASVVVLSGDCRRNVHPVCPPRDLGTGGWRLAPTRQPGSMTRTDGAMPLSGHEGAAIAAPSSLATNPTARGSVTNAVVRRLPARQKRPSESQRLTPAPDTSAPHRRPQLSTPKSPLRVMRAPQHPISSCPSADRATRARREPCACSAHSHHQRPQPSLAVLNGGTCGPRHDSSSSPRISHPRTASDSPDAEEGRDPESVPSRPRRDVVVRNHECEHVPPTPRYGRPRPSSVSPPQAQSRAHTSVDASCTRRRQRFISIDSPGEPANPDRVRTSPLQDRPDVSRETLSYVALLVSSIPPPRLACGLSAQPGEGRRPKCAKRGATHIGSFRPHRQECPHGDSECHSHSRHHTAASVPAARHQRASQASRH